jgi:hypothetical protein
MPTSADQTETAHDESLVYGSQPAHKKLLNRRYHADALTSAPAPATRHPHGVAPRGFNAARLLGLQPVIKKFGSRFTHFILGSTEFFLLNVTLMHAAGVLTC